MPWWAGLAALLLADTVYGFQQTAITPALPVIEQDLQASREWTTWLFSGYFIVASVAPVFLGKLADRTGKRRIYLAALVVFLAGSVGASFAPTIGVLVTCRIIQGAGGAVFPLSFSMVSDHLPEHRTRQGISILTGGFGLGALAGFVVGGYLAQSLSWRWIFIVGALALAVAVVLVRLTVRRSTVRSRRGLDTPGAVLFGIAMATLIMGLTEGPNRGWAAPLVIALFAIAGLAAVCWVLRELHTAEPLMDLRALASRPVLMANAASVCVGYAVIGVNLLLPFLVGVTGQSTLTLFGLAAGPLLTGVMLVPRAIGQSVGGPLCIPLGRWLGSARAFAFGMVLVAIGAFGLAVWRDRTWMVLLELASVGVGFGVAITMGGSVVMMAAAADQTGIATSINSVLRRAGGAVGAQVSAALLGAISLHGTPTSGAFSVAFGVAAAVAAVGAVIALFIAVPAANQRDPAQRTAIDADD